MEVNYTVPNIVGDSSGPVYVVMHYCESYDTPAPMAGGYNVARTVIAPFFQHPPLQYLTTAAVYVSQTLDGALDCARRFKIHRNQKITSVDHSPIDFSKLFHDHLGVVIGQGWQLDVRKRPDGQPSLEMMADAYELVRWLRTLQVVGRELIWVEKQWMSTVW